MVHPIPVNEVQSDKEWFHYGLDPPLDGVGELIDDSILNDVLNTDVFSSSCDPNPFSSLNESWDLDTSLKFNLADAMISPSKDKLLSPGFDPFEQDILEPFQSEYPSTTNKMFTDDDFTSAMLKDMDNVYRCVNPKEIHNDFSSAIPKEIDNDDSSAIPKETDNDSSAIPKETDNYNPAIESTSLTVTPSKMINPLPTLDLKPIIRSYIDYDHCYSVPVGLIAEDSSSEVDVVTVFPAAEEVKIPVVPKKRTRGQNGVKKCNNISAKSLKAAMKRTAEEVGNRSYKRQKISNSVETTSASSFTSSAPSSLCNSDVEDAGKRANHNSSERRRREILRTALQDLRVCVPEIDNNPKAPKVQILTASKDYILDLKVGLRTIKKEKKLELRRNRALTLKLDNLENALRKLALIPTL